LRPLPFLAFLFPLANAANPLRFHLTVDSQHQEQVSIQQLAIEFLQEHDCLEGTFHNFFISHSIYYQESEYESAHRWTNIHLASYFGLDKILASLFRQVPAPIGNINEMNQSGESPCYIASRQGHDKAVQILVDRGANVNARGGEYGNALQAASSGGHDKVVQILINGGADITAQGGQYGIALEAASSGGHDKVVQILIDRGADITAQGGQYGNALQAASYGGHDKVVQILIDRGADINAQGEFYGNALIAAAAGGSEKMVQMLIDLGADANAQGGHYGNALITAVKGGNEKEGADAYRCRSRR